uniref:PiggyBac transposable element-derived protein 4 n=2 Tax=Pararge aegeria TaxID=116150 RepID=S4P9J6_9NEOP
MSDSEDDPDYQPPTDEESESMCTYSDATSSEESVELSTSHQHQHSSEAIPCRSIPNSSWNIPLSDGSRKKQFPFTVDPGMKNIGSDCQTELDFLFLFLDNEIIDLMVRMTNSYAIKTQILKRVTRNSRLSKWNDCDAAEMKKFLGLLIWMGLKKLPKISDYWSTDVLYENNVAKRVMSRNRFELLLRCWHFEDAYYIGMTGTDRLIKIRRFVEILSKKFGQYKTPGEFLTVDETMVAFRGRIAFMQYIPGKRHKYGIKLFKICDDDGYTYDLIVYEGKRTTSTTQNVSSEIVMKLSDQYLNAGRSIVTDNYYTSVTLANSLLQKSTHLLGTLRKNRKGLPKELLKEKLKKGETCVMENNDGVLILRWKDKRDVLALSTRHTPSFVSVRSKRNRNKVTMKPTLIADYNRHKCAIDYSDQMGSYCNPARRSLRWFQKLAIELLFSTSLINAFILFKNSKNLTSKKYTITTFKENICRTLMGLDQQRRQGRINQDCSAGHRFGKSTLVDQRNRIVRRRCIHCYEKKREEGLTSVEACKVTKKVNTVCLLCPSNPSVCSECFANFHSAIVRQ